jgi:hypothetical protein
LDNEPDEGDIRKNLIVADLAYCMVAPGLPGSRFVEGTG